VTAVNVELFGLVTTFQKRLFRLCVTLAIIAVYR